MLKKLEKLLRLLLMLPVFAILRLLVKLGFSQRVIKLAARQMNPRQSKQRAFAGYTPTAADVFVATFSKSGTNWMMQMAQQIAYFGEAEFEHIHDLVPWPEPPIPFGTAELDDDSIARKSPTGLRVIKAHYEREFIPFHAVAKYIVVVRDPKEVFVSSYYFGKETIGTLLGVDYTVAEWLSLFQTADFPFGYWAEHTASWWSVRHQANVLLLLYNDIKRNPRQTVQQVAELMGVALTNEQVDKVVEKSSFAYMKAHQSQFAPNFPSLGRKPPPTILIRSGKSGASGELITHEQQAVIDRYCQAELARLGCDFPYTAVFDTTA